jgi:predicted transcriptional regulator
MATKMMFPEVLFVKISTDMKKKISAAAKKREIPTSAMIREAVREKLEKENASLTK